MSRAILRQVYHMDDSAEQVAEKMNRLADSIDTRSHAVTVEVKRYTKPRSDESNAYLWAVVYPLMSNASGYEVEELHGIMCAKFFGTTAIKVMGEIITRPCRTTTTDERGERAVLSPAEFSEFLEFVIREAALWFDLAIPPPRPVAPPGP